MLVFDSCHHKVTLWEGRQNLFKTPRQEASHRLRAIFLCKGHSCELLVANRSLRGQTQHLRKGDVGGKANSIYYHNDLCCYLMEPGFSETHFRKQYAICQMLVGDT